MFSAVIVCVCVRTLAAWGVQAMWTVLGLTPFALGRLKREKRLFRLPRSPFGSEPLYLGACEKTHPRAHI